VNDCLLLLPWGMLSLSRGGIRQSCATQNQVRYVAVAHDTYTTPSGRAMGLGRARRTHAQAAAKALSKHKRIRKKQRKHALPRFLVPSWLNYGRRGGRQEAKQPPRRLPHLQRLWRALIIGVRDFWASIQHMNIGIAGSPKRGLMWSSRAHLWWWLQWLLGKKRVAVARAGPLKAQRPETF